MVANASVYMLDLFVLLPRWDWDIAQIYHFVHHIYRLPKIGGLKSSTEKL